jgi:CIC family chloride channel protein
MSESEDLQPHSAPRLRVMETRELFTLMLLGCLTGLGAGLAAIVLNLGVHSLEHWRHGLPSPPLLIVIPSIGAGLGIFIQRVLLRDRAAHGVPEVIESVRTGGGVLNRRMLFSRLISSCLTVGSGGAAGLEGPIVVSGASVGSAMGRLFHLPESRRVLLIACGTSGAIGAIFNAPITGLIFSLEVILGEWKARNLVPTITSAAVATQFARHVVGDKIPFSHEQLTTTPFDLPASMLLGLFCALLGWILVQSLSQAGKWFKRLPLGAPWVAALGGLGVGLIGALQPHAMGEGYPLIRALITQINAPPWQLILLLIVLRLLTTALTLGSGGSGGVFAPSLFFGSALGFLFGTSLNHSLFAQAFSSSGAYALLGMAGLVAAVMNAPLTGMFLVFEISDCYDLILPLMVCSLTAMIAYRLLERESIYTRDLHTPGVLRQRGSGLHILAGIEAKEWISHCPTLQDSSTLKDYVATFGEELPEVIALLGPGEQFRGLVFLQELKPILLNRDIHGVIFLESLLRRDAEPLRYPFRADLVLQQFRSTQAPALAVLDEKGQWMGIVQKEHLLHSLHQELLANS